MVTLNLPGLFLSLPSIFPFPAVLPWLEEIDFFFLFFLFFGGATVQGTSFKCALDFHIVGLNERAGDVHGLALLEAVLFFFNAEFAALGL